MRGTGDVYVRSGLQGYPEFGPDCYSPQAAYPEYPWPADLSANANDVYQNIREALRDWGLDHAKFGSSHWNPMGAFVSPGDTVVLKPNWVSHRNNNPDADTDCLVTHTSLLRCIIDYCIIALNGTGRIVVADAPIQAADLAQLLSANHVNDLVAFYAKRGVILEIADLRMYRTLGRHGVYVEREGLSPADDSVEVELGSNSRFSEIDACNRTYSVMDYSVDDTRPYHSPAHHVYSINRRILEADVIINLPKPKTHKLAGMTGALKNMVGIVAEKACLPHESLGPMSGQGDSYSAKSVLKSASSKLREYKAKQERHGRFLPALLARYADALIRRGAWLGHGDRTQFGGWYGNDTIWRTVLDLNQIVQFSDCDGEMHTQPQRRIVHIADMVVSGQGEGPLAPSPKNVGMVVFGLDALLMDIVIARLMGFDESKIPTLAHASQDVGLDFEEVTVEIGGLRSTCSRLSGILVSAAGPFRPTSGWVGHIEMSESD